MRLKELLHILPEHRVLGELPGGQVAGLTYDSRKAGAGMVFAALKGVKTDGRRFVAAAARAGSLAALVERPVEEAAICQIIVPDARLALSLVAHEFYGRPGEGLNCIAITGTNGKTTTSYLMESMLGQKGPVGVVGTVDARYMDQRRPAAMTTPESVDLMAVLAEMRNAGVQSAVLEISSHALEQRRADAIAFEAAVFTNLSRDHLDYHGDMESYFRAKARLFSELLPRAQKQGKTGLAVCGWDDPYGRRLAGICRELGLGTLTFGFEDGADVQGSQPRLSLAGGSFLVSHKGGRFGLSTPMVGGFNLLNMLAAAASGLGLGMAVDEVVKGLESLRGVPGRLQRVGRQTPYVFVDYSHTPDALQKACAALKPLTRGRLICVFGAGGDRDPGKRPLMGQAAGQGADLVVVTSDNPRSEDPLQIIRAIEPGLGRSGCQPVRNFNGQPGKVYVSEPDREAAIHLAISQAGDDDVVLIAGKGHEDYQIVGENKNHFDDREKAQKALAARKVQQAEAAGA